MEKVLTTYQYYIHMIRNTMYGTLHYNNFIFYARVVV